MSLNSLNSKKKIKAGTAAFFGCVLFVLLAFHVFTESSVTIAAGQGDDTKKAESNSQGDGHKEQKQSKQDETPRPTHKHSAFRKQKKARNRMVTRQIERRGVDNPDVLRAMRTVPRHAFVSKHDLHRAYRDHPLPIGLGQTISQPYIVAYMTEALKLGPDSKVLEVGTGSGYQAAVCAEIAKEVFTIEILEKLAESAKKRLAELGYLNVHVKYGDGYYGWLENGPFDAIIITAAAGMIPPPLIEQLKPGGRMLLPLGSPYGVQTLVLVTKNDKGRVRTRRLIGVRFVPMIGKVMEEKESREK
jgi:protein-L-isoaspartate(D-aspartate) O-methyltransferase